MTGFCSRRNSCCSASHGASSVTRGQVCRVTGHSLFLCCICTSFFEFFTRFPVFSLFYVYIYTDTHTHTCIQCFYIHARSVSPGIVLHIMPNFYTYGSLDTWTIVCVCLTATKNEPFIFPALGFAFAYVSNIYIFMLLYDFCLLPAYFFYIIVNVRNFERQM